MKSIVIINVTGLFTSPKTVSIFDQMPLSEKSLIHKRRRKQLNHDT
jgi:hypothetical protein